MSARWGVQALEKVEGPSEGKTYNQIAQSADPPSRGGTPIDGVGALIGGDLGYLCLAPHSLGDEIEITDVNHERQP